MDLMQVFTEQYKKAQPPGVEKVFPMPLGYTSRNHCPFCLCSLHVDINPGDRANDCGGILRPIRTEPDPKKGYVIIHRCDRCGAVVRNKAAHEAKVQPDDMDLLIRLTAASI